MKEAASFAVTYGSYLEEIRKRVYRLAIVFAAAFVIGISLTGILLPFLVQFLTIEHVTVTTTSPFQLLELAMNTGFFTGLIVAIPFALHQSYTFLRDGLLPHERRLIFLLIPLSLLLFVLGFSYGFAVMYYAVQFIAGVNTLYGITNLWSITQFISQILITSALLGCLFQFPVVLSGLIRIGVCSVDFVRRNRRIAYAMIFVFVALLPPTDGLSFLVMSLPLIGMYELTIIGNSFSPRKELLKT